MAGTSVCAFIFQDVSSVTASATMSEHDIKIKAMLQDLHDAVCTAQEERNFSEKNLDNISKAHDKIEAENKCD